jgi:hypothetical protein
MFLFVIVLFNSLFVIVLFSCFYLFVIVLFSCCYLFVVVLFVCCYLFVILFIASVKVHVDLCLWLRRCQPANSMFPNLEMLAAVVAFLQQHTAVPVGSGSSSILFRLGSL